MDIRRVDVYLCELQMCRVCVEMLIKCIFAVLPNGIRSPLWCESVIGSDNDNDGNKELINETTNCVVFESKSEICSTHE